MHPDTEPQPDPTPQETEPQDEAQEKPEAKEEVAEDSDAEKPEGEEPAEDAEGKTADAGEPEEKRKRAGGWQRKIERLERQNEQLVQQLVARQAPAPTATPDKDKTPEEKAAAYIDNLVEQRLAARETQQKQQTVVTEFQRRTAEVRAAHADFDDVVTSADIPVESALGQALLTSEHGPEIMYQLASNPAELARLGALPAIVAAREVGRLEAKLASSTTTPNGTSRPTAKRSAPAPITPVTARGPTTVKPVDEMSYEEYSAWRERQRKR